jgi:hypothetical protein
MTPAALHELVRDVPEVWPLCLTCVHDEDDELQWVYGDYDGTRVQMFATDAADLILAGVVRKLAEDEVFVLPDSANRAWRAWEFSYSEGGRELMLGTSGPTMLHAALAAYRKLRQPNPVANQDATE